VCVCVSIHTVRLCRYDALYGHNKCPVGDDTVQRVMTADGDRTRVATRRVAQQLEAERQSSVSRLAVRCMTVSV